MSQTRKLLGVAILAMSVSTTLTACGETKGERAISGGAIGAGAGAAAGAVTGGSILEGAALGGAAGAATGALTDKDDIDLGEEVIDLEDED